MGRLINMSAANRIARLVLDSIKWFFYGWDHPTQDKPGWLSSVDGYDETIKEREAFLEEGEDRRASDIERVNLLLDGRPDEFIDKSYMEWLMEKDHEQE